MTNFNRLEAHSSFFLLILPTDTDHTHTHTQFVVAANELRVYADFSKKIRSLLLAAGFLTFLYVCVPHHNCACMCVSGFLSSCTTLTSGTENWCGGKQAKSKANGLVLNH